MILRRFFHFRRPSGLTVPAYVDYVSARTFLREVSRQRPTRNRQIKRCNAGDTCPMYEEDRVARPMRVRVAYLTNVNADAYVTIYKDFFPRNKGCGWFEQRAQKYNGS